MRHDTHLRRAVAAILIAALAAPVGAAECGADGTLIRDAAARGRQAADMAVNANASAVMSASQGRSSCLERFGVQSIGTGNGVLDMLTQGAMESACNQARGAAGRYLDQVQGAIPTLQGVNLPSLQSVSLQQIGNQVAGQVAGEVQNRVQQARQTAEQSVWDRLSCWVQGC